MRHRASKSHTVVPEMKLVELQSWQAGKVAGAHQSVAPGVFLLQKDHLQKGVRGKSIKEYYFLKCYVNKKWPQCGQLAQLCFSGMHRGSGWPRCLLISELCCRTGLEDHESFHVFSSSSGISFLLADQELPPCP